MKKTLLFLLAFCSILSPTKAQIQKGTYTMRPDLSIARQTSLLSSSSTAKISSTSIGMSYGRFIADNLLLSAGLGGYFSKSVKQYSVSVGSTYYYLQEFKIKPYVSGGLSFSSDNFTSSQSPTKKHYNQLDALLGTGAQYFINENIALDLHCALNIFGIKPQTMPLLNQEYRLSLKPFYTVPYDF
jgi:Outer membrane protein beta-barrel domain